MNKLAITVTLALEEESFEDAYLDFLLTVDGGYIHDSQYHWIDPVQLASSAGHSGEFYIFTCNCGDPGCVGIDRGVMVTHGAEEIVWRLRMPMGWPAEEELPDWAHEVELHFPRDEYVNIVDSALQQAKALVRHWRSPGRLWPGPDLSVAELLALQAGTDSGMPAVSAGRFVH